MFDFTQTDGEPTTSGAQNANNNVMVAELKPSTASTSEHAPLLSPLTPVESIESTKNGDQHTAERRAQLIRQDDLRGRSESPPRTPPVVEDESSQNEPTEETSSL